MITRTVRATLLGCGFPCHTDACQTPSVYRHADWHFPDLSFAKKNMEINALGNDSASDESFNNE